VTHAAATACVLLLAACARTEQREVWLVVRADATDGVKLGDARVAPDAALVETHADRDRVALRVRVTAEPLIVSAPGACPLTLRTGDVEPGGTLERRFVPLFDLGPATRVVGLAKHFELRAVARCAEANATRVELRVTGGAPLAHVVLSENGRVFSAETSGLAQPLVAGGAPSIVPISAAARGATELSARETLADGTVLERPLEVAAVARSSGLPNVGVGHALVLAGDALTVTQRPAGSSATLRAAGNAFELTPDARGTYVVSDAHGRELSLDAARYDETPLDCARSDCHAALGASAQTNPMLHALADDLDGRHPLPSAACTLACHTTGEPGTADGGFSDVLAAFASGTSLPDRFAALPRALQRAAGVGCLACHGPGSLPQASARWAVLRSDVCAVCHDAPPRYGHVRALAASAMSRADADARTRRDPSCARCHTTWGALARPERAAPLDAPAFGIGCAACHDVHPHGAGQKAVGPALLRDLPLPEAFAGVEAAHGPSRVCVGCHAPAGEALSASAAALWAGRGGVEPETGAALERSAPHARDARGCVGCHDAGPSDLALGGGHAFHAAAAACGGCHDRPLPRDAALAQRAERLFGALAPARARNRAASDPPHVVAADGALPPERARALRDVLLVLEDPAADVHNPAYAKLLLDRAEPFAGATP